jgi:hypothetical protein
VPLPQKKLIPGLLLALVIAALAAPPLWWSTGDPPVIDPAATENNHAPANIGQAKHMAKSALDALRPILPAVADQIEEDLVGPGKPIPSWAAPANQAEIDKNHAPLLIGQLKAIADPFYTHLHTAAPAWLEAERTANGTNRPGSIFPWTSATTDDNNKGVANIGQLKAVFSLRFEKDSDIDGMPDAWEEASGLDPDDYTDANDDLDDDGLTNLEEHGNGTDPANPDTDNDGATDDEEVLQGNDPKNPSNKPVAQWLVLTGDLGAGEEKSRSRTVTIPKGESRLLVVALQSAEFPRYTNYFSQFDDLLTWYIRPQGKDAVTGEVHVNDRHTDWELAEQDGVEILGYGPAHIETTAKYSAPGDSDLVIEIDLSATNVSDGALPSTVMVGVLPVDVKENVANQANNNIAETGVDAVSKTAVAGDIGYVEDFWIMAPLGGAEFNNKTLFRIGMGASDTGELACANGTPTPAYLDLDNNEETIEWIGTGTGVDSEEPVKTSINGSGEKFPLPVKVKAMKYRTVKLRVCRVKKDLGGGTFVDIDGSIVPDEEEFEEYLNRLFGYQLNAWFDVTIHTDIKPLAFGSDFHVANPHAQDQADAYNLFDQHDQYDMQVFIVGKNGSLTAPNSEAYGYSSIDNKTCWVMGLQTGSYNSKQKVLETVSHEIGHMFFGEGHPDSPDPLRRGKAPLVGTDHTKRLMHSANGSTSRLIVKKEWDEAEKWLKSNIDTPTP